MISENGQKGNEENRPVVARQVLHTRIKRLERCFYGLDGFGVFGVGKELFGGRHHFKRGAEARAVFVFRNEVEMQVGQFVGVRAIVDLGGAKGGLDGLGGAGNVLGKQG